MKEKMPAIILGYVVIIVSMLALDVATNTESGIIQFIYILLSLPITVFFAKNKKERKSIVYKGFRPVVSLYLDFCICFFAVIISMFFFHGAVGKGIILFFIFCVSYYLVFSNILFKSIGFFALGLQTDSDRKPIGLICSNGLFLLSVSLMLYFIKKNSPLATIISVVYSVDILLLVITKRNIFFHVFGISYYKVNNVCGGQEPAV
jgi:hypothetical protein